MSYIIRTIIRRPNSNVQRQHVRILRRSLRDAQNPYEQVTEEFFIKLYRLPKQLCLALTDELVPFLKNSARKHAIPSHIKVLSAVRFFATGSFQQPVGQDALSALSQTSVSRCIQEVSVALGRIAHRHAQFPKRDEFAAIKQGFYEKYNFPGIIGLIDGTHIKIVGPNNDIEHVCYCRKGGYSKNVQIVCDTNHRILSCNAGFGGTAHYAYVYRRSRASSTLQELYQSGERNYWGLGDSAYPLQPWLMTPFSTPTTAAESRYNSAHKQTRSIVERCVGILKGRFRCISKERVLWYSPQKATLIINACVVLHNILINANVPIDETLIEDESDSDETPEEIDKHFNSRKGNNCARSVLLNI